MALEMLARFPLPGLAPQLALGAGLAAALAAGAARRAPAVSRAVAAAALLCAAALAWTTEPGAAAGVLARVDGFALAWILLFCVGALPFVAAARSRDEVVPALALASVLGMGLLAASSNLIMLFIGLEFLSLPAYLLVARAPGRRSGAQEAAVKYFFMGSAAGALFLLGLACHYAASRTLALSASGGALAGAGVALMGCAALFKAGCVPLHFWLPDVYESAAPELAGFLSTAVKSAAVLLLMRVVALAPQSAFARCLPALGALTMIFGALMALRQPGLQRLLAYSSVSHAGNLILGVGAWAAQGLAPAAAAAVYLYLAAYVLMSNGAFLFVRVSGLTTRAELLGYARRAPALAALFCVILLALGGVPPAAGFLAKLFVLWEALKAGLLLPAFLGGLASLIGLGYYLGLVRDMYFSEPAAAGAPACVPGRGAAAALCVCALGSAALGLAPGLIGVFTGWLSR